MKATLRRMTAAALTAGALACGDATTATTAPPSNPFTATVAWTPTGDGFAYSGNGYGSVGYDSAQFWIIGDNGSEGSFQLVITAPPHIGTYTFGDGRRWGPPPYPPFAIYSSPYVYGENGGVIDPGHDYVTEQAGAGTLTITAYDPATRKISGRFWFTATAPDGYRSPDGGPARVYVTGGSFIDACPGRRGLTPSGACE